MASSSTAANAGSIPVRIYKEKRFMFYSYHVHRDKKSKKSAESDLK
jgi:hypothetical protein